MTVQTSKHKNDVLTIPDFLRNLQLQNCHSSCRWVASSSSICSTRCFNKQNLLLSLWEGKPIGKPWKHGYHAVNWWLLGDIPRCIYLDISWYISIYLSAVLTDASTSQWYAVWSNLTSYHVLMGFRRLQVTRQVARNQKTKAPVLCDSMNSPWTWPYYLGWPSILRLVWSETQKP